MTLGFARRSPGPIAPSHPRRRRLRIRPSHPRARWLGPWGAALLVLALLQFSVTSASHAHPIPLGPSSVSATVDLPDPTRAPALNGCPICGVLLGCAALTAKRAIDIDHGLVRVPCAPERRSPRATARWTANASRAPPSAHR